jgi:putative SOS response-associated peptidase YedK
MCGRYLYKYDKDDKELINLIKMIDNKRATSSSGEIFPTNNTDAIVRNVLTTLKWGYQLNKKTLIINARSESILQKPLFKNSFLTGKRCLIPANAFYEWKPQNSKKIKFKIFNKKSTFFLAGLYKNFKDTDGNSNFCYVILTGEANNDIKSIHNRMPIIINSFDNQNKWLNKETKTDDLNKIINTSLNNHFLTEID